LAFNPNFELRLFDINNEVFAFQVSRNFDSDINVAYCLRPFVREGCLFCSFVGTSGLVGSGLFCIVLSYVPS
jgi:hypothetical protein